MSDTYSAVDRARDVARALEWQERIDDWPQIRAYKARSGELAGDHGAVLDVGAGTGFDLRVMAGPAFGVDASWAMCSYAHERGSPVAQADASRLPFPDETFHAVRADRVVQHVADPRRVVEEMVRATRRAGRVIVCDPDQDTLTIAVPGVRDSLVEAVRDLRRTVGYRNGHFVAQLPGELLRMGLDDVTVDAFPLVLRDPDDAFGLPTWVRYYGDRFSADDAEEWDRGIARARAHGGFVYALLYFVVSGRRP